MKYIKSFENFIVESKEKDSRLKAVGVEGYNKPKITHKNKLKICQC